MPAVLLEHKGKMLSNELGTRNATFASSPGKEPVVVRIQRDRGRLLPRECHGSNMTWRGPVVKRMQRGEEG
jgi:hypothetical protein